MRFPAPPNPYAPGLIICGLLGVAGTLLTSAFFQEVRYPARDPLFLLSGVMFLTFAFIFGIAALFGFFSHRKHMHPERLVGYWKVEDRPWVNWARDELKQTRNRFRSFWWFFLLVPVGIGVSAWGDNTLGDPLLWRLCGGLLILAGLALGFWFWFSTHSLRKTSCEVWLAPTALQMGNRFQALQSYGVQTTQISLRSDSAHPELQTLSIRFLIQSQRGPVERTLDYPLPESQLNNVQSWITETKTQLNL